MPRTLEGLRDRRDAARFHGRVRELSLLEDLLAPEPVRPVVLLHGPAGSGVSTVARELARRAAARGIAVVRIDGFGRGRRAPGSTGSGAVARAPGSAGSTAGNDLAAAFAALPRRGAALLVIDDAERLPDLPGRLLALLPDASCDLRILVAGRGTPDRRWAAAGWDALVGTLALGPLPDRHADVLLARRGVADPGARAAIVRWARGLPAALALAADAGSTDPEADDDLATRLLERLVGDALVGQDDDVLATAALLPHVDARTLAAVLPGVDGEAAERRLRVGGLAAGSGPRTAMEPRIRDELAAELHRRAPQRERALRRTLADHLHRRIVLGEPEAAHALVGLMAAAGPASGGLHVDRVRRGDLAVLDHAEPGTASAATRRFLAEAPELVTIVRDRSGAVAGWGVSVRSDAAPAWAAEDPLLTAWLAHAGRHHPGEVALLRRDAATVGAPPDGDPTPGIAVLLDGADAARHGAADVRRLYRRDVAAPGDAETPRPSSPGDASHPGPVATVDGRLVRCAVVEIGAGGLAGALHAAVLRDLGVRPAPAVAPEELGATVVRDALRAFHDPLALAGSPLARGTTPEERAASVRRQVHHGLAIAFGPSADGELLRAIIVRGYLDPDCGHARAALELHLSRSAYFRRLATATARMCELVLAERGLAAR